MRDFKNITVAENAENNRESMQITSTYGIQSYRMISMDREHARSAPRYNYRITSPAALTAHSTKNPSVDPHEAPLPSY